MTLRRFASVFLVFLALSACGTEDDPKAQPPAAQEVTLDSVGHYCGMNLVEHSGPKGQIFVYGRETPVWFTAIKQVFAYTLLPEEPKGISAIYVHDMGKVHNWNQPETGTWIDARSAFYVIESEFIGGMGAEDALPFGDKAKALEFADKYRGRVVSFNDMPEHYILNHDAAAQGLKSAPSSPHGEPSH